MPHPADQIKYVPYRQKDEPSRRAAITQVDFPLQELSDEEIQILGHLNDAAELMNPIFRDQYESRTATLHKLLQQLIKVADGENRSKLENYFTLLNLQNSPFCLLPRKNLILEMEEEDLRALAKKAGKRTVAALDTTIDLLLKGQETPDFANFYPADFKDEEYESLNHPVNSSIIRNESGQPVVVLNEKRYRQTLSKVIEHLKKARHLTKDPTFRIYLDAKIVELETGSEEARRLADYTWVRHKSPIDIVISSAIEVYLDNYKNARGAAAACVTRVNYKAEDLLKSLVNLVPTFETQAPWTYKKTNIDPETLPKLKFADVLNWSGDYVTGPFTTIAQSLPNDEWVMKNIGTVNMVYLNTGKAIHRVSGNLAAEEFLAASEYDAVKELIFDANQLHSALHEIGHTTGRMDPKHTERQPKDYLEEEYSWLEETRAELFGLWALRILVDEGVVTPEMARACYDGMLITMVLSLKFDPVQAHNKARNAMFHYFDEKDIFERVLEDGKIKFLIDHNAAQSVVDEMLKIVGDLKSKGEKKEAATFRKTFIYPDSLKIVVEERTSTFPHGRGLLFPSLKKEGDRFLADMEYPDDFNLQNKFLLNLE